MVADLLESFPYSWVRVRYKGRVRVRVRFQEARSAHCPALQCSQRAELMVLGECWSGLSLRLQGPAFSWVQGMVGSQGIPRAAPSRLCEQHENVPPFLLMKPALLLGTMSIVF